MVCYSLKWTDVRLSFESIIVKLCFCFHILRICGGDPNFSILEVESTEDLCLTPQTGENIFACIIISNTCVRLCEKVWVAGN